MSSPPHQHHSGDAPITRSNDVEPTSQATSINMEQTAQQSSTTSSTSTSDTPSPGPPPASNAPRMPWNGPIPSFFVMGPNGSLMPHFHPRSASPPNQPTPARTDAPTPDLQHTIFPFPGLTPGSIPGHPIFSTFLFGMPSTPRPNPQAAAELLRSLPTVSKGLFRRVNNVLKAEQELDGENEDDKGWKCGICLEGVEEDSKETGVKVLPCNHLFHGDCLEPWFTTNHTCPTCRLDLDPGRTLRSNPPPGPRRPTATGSGRQSPHPYNRQPINSGQTVDDDRPASPAVEIRVPDNNPHEFTFIWRLPNPNSSPSPSPSGNETTQPSNTARPTIPGDQETPPAPSTPTISFDLPLTASPAAMPSATNSHVTSAPSALQSETAETVGEGRPQPERRLHFNLVHHHHHLPAPGHHNQPIQTSPHHHHHIHQRHLPRPSGESTPYPPANTPPPVLDQSSPTLRAEEAGALAPVQDQANHAQSPSPASVAAPETPNENSNIPHFHFFINFPDGAPLFPPPFPPPAQAAPAPPAQAPAQELRVPTPPPVDRPTLTAWVEDRERRLGWRCDAPDCGIAPADDDDDDVFSSFVDSDKEMIPIYSERQPAAAIYHPYSPDSARSFELHACPHRWHRACLESVELSSGRPMRVDEEGRCWVRCERCRTDGWIRGRLRSPSESVVERMVFGA